MITPEANRRIAQAVAAAEARTSGEIVCILAQEVSQYRETSLGWASAVSLLLVPALAAFDLWPSHWPTGWLGAAGWNGAATAAAATRSAVEFYAASQVLTFVVVAAIVTWPPVRRVLTPGFLKSHRVHRTAAQQFLATGMHADTARTGMVIFASLHDRRVEVLSDKAIHDAVGEAVCAKAVAAVQAGMKRGDAAAGFVAAVEICGAALAEHFPATGERVNALSDNLLEI